MHSPISSFLAHVHCRLLFFKLRYYSILSSFTDESSELNEIAYISPLFCLQAYVKHCKGIYLALASEPSINHQEDVMDPESGNLKAIIIRIFSVAKITKVFMSVVRLL